MLAVSGAASLVLGTAIIGIPRAATWTIVLWIGIYAFVFGALLVGLGIRLRTVVLRPEALGQ